MCACMPVCLSTCPPAVCPSICLSVCPSVCASLRPNQSSGCLSVHPCTRRCVCPSTWLCIHLSVCASVRVSGRVSVPVGVLMWEVFSEGRMPYEHITNSQVVEALATGLRLLRPRLASDALHLLMEACWRQVGKI